MARLRKLLQFLVTLWLFVFVFLSGKLALAYNLSLENVDRRLHWSRSVPLVWAIDPAAHGGERLEEALALAVSNWCSGTNADIALVGEVAFQTGNPLKKRPYPGMSSVTILSDWPWAKNELAMTYLIYSEASGRILEADILINGQNIDWDPESGYDLENALTHEIGHLLGLGHSKEAEATMFARTYPREIKKRTLHEDDRQGLSVLYATAMSPAFGCRGGPENLSGGLVFLMLTTGLLFFRRSRFLRKRV